MDVSGVGSFLESVGAIFSALGLKMKVVFAGAMGAFISLRFFDGLSTWEKWTTFFGGVIIGSYLSVPLAQFMSLTSDFMENGLAIGLGLFGMSIASALIKVIRDTSWAEIIKSKISGGDK